MLNRDEAIQLVKEHDGNLDPLCVRDFCEFCGYRMDGSQEAPQSYAEEEAPAGKKKSSSR